MCDTKEQTHADLEKNTNIEIMSDRLRGRRLNKKIEKKGKERGTGREKEEKIEKKVNRLRKWNCRRLESQTSTPQIVDSH